MKRISLLLVSLMLSVLSVGLLADTVYEEKMELAAFKGLVLRIWHVFMIIRSFVFIGSIEFFASIQLEFGR